MGLLKTTGLFLGGFCIGSVATWNMDQILYERIKQMLGYEETSKADYLSIKSELPLEQRREMFLMLLQELGMSWRLNQMISEFKHMNFNKKKIENSNEDDIEEQMDLLERLFRSYYPELFDDDHGAYDFIKNMNLKLYCEDHYNVVPFLRAPPK